MRDIRLRVNAASYAPGLLDYFLSLCILLHTLHGKPWIFPGS